MNDVQVILKRCDTIDGAVIYRDTDGLTHTFVLPLEDPRGENLRVHGQVLKVSSQIFPSSVLWWVPESTVNGNVTKTRCKNQSKSSYLWVVPHKINKVKTSRVFLQNKPYYTKYHNETSTTWVIDNHSISHNEVSMMNDDDPDHISWFNQASKFVPPRSCHILSERSLPVGATRVSAASPIGRRLSVTKNLFGRTCQ